MSVFDLFRRFFQPPGVRDPFFGGMTLDDDDDDDDDDDKFFQGPHRPGFQSPFWHQSTPFHDPFGFEDIFRDFNALFADFDSMMHGVSGLPGIDPSKRNHEESRGGSLRDSMLKYPDSHLPREQTPSSQDPGTLKKPHLQDWPAQWQKGKPSTSDESKQDKVLDSEVSSRGLDSILRPQEPASSSFFRSVSVSKVIMPDGTVEERRTVQDGQGNTTTTVTVTKGKEVLSRASPDSPRDAITDQQDSLPILPPSLPNLLDSQTILSRILQRWFSGR